MIVDCYQVLGIKLECLQVFVMSQNTLVVSSRDPHKDILMGLRQPLLSTKMVFAAFCVSLWGIQVLSVLSISDVKV